MDCGTGDFTESQTDLAIGGRGVGLDLTRNYSAQAARRGRAGFRLRMDQLLRSRLAAKKGAKVTLTEASGATVPFTRSGPSYLAPGWSRDTLTGSAEAGFTLTLATRRRRNSPAPGASNR